MSKGRRFVGGRFAYDILSETRNSESDHPLTADEIHNVVILPLQNSPIEEASYREFATSNFTLEDMVQQQVRKLEKLCGTKLTEVPIS